MARPREFEPDAAIAAAMRLFWQQGYDAVSLDDIVRSAGASRKGLYGLWTGKRALLVAALARYRQEIGDHLFSELERDGAGIADVAEFWNRFEGAVRKRSWRGCLVMRTAVTEIAREDDVAAEIAVYLDRLIGSVGHALHGAAARGELAPGIDPAAATHQVFAVAVASSTLGVLEGYGPRLAGLIVAGRAACGLAPARRPADRPA